MNSHAITSNHTASDSRITSLASYGGQRVATIAPVIAMDLFVALSTFAIAAIVLKDGHSVWGAFPVFVMGLGLSGMAAGLFRIIGVHPVTEVRQIVTTAAMSMCSLVGMALLVSAKLPLARLILAHVLLAICLPFLRALARTTLAQTSWWGIRCFVYGCNRRVNSLFEQHIANQSIGLKPVGFVEPALTAGCKAEFRCCYVGNEDTAAGLQRELRVHSAIVHRHGRSDGDVTQYADQHLGAFSLVSVAGDDLRLPVLSQSTAYGRSYETQASRLSHRLAKRTLDVLVASAALLIGLPVLLILAAWTYLSDPGPIFFGHERIGKNGRRFKVWKFRSMIVNSQEALQQHLAANPEAQAEWDATQKLQNDPRITAVGRLLRKTSMDELPQLWNVIKGEMSLVGPRPIVANEVAKYADSYDSYLSVSPGITGFWQVSGRNLTTYDRRVELDRFYVRNWSIWFDLYLLGRTLKTVLCREGAF